jgi:hypothetical protein
MLRKLFAGAAVVGLLASTPVSAATYMSVLEYWDDDGITLVDPAFGYVLLEEAGDGKTVNVSAYLDDDAKWQQSGANNIFAFNLADDGATAIDEDHDLNPDVLYGGAASYTHAPWGTFTDFFYVTKSGKNGRLPGPFEFTAFNDGGLTFAGLGATFDLDGRLLTTGTGNRFASNAGGWWFMGHIQPDGSDSINIAARDAFCIAGCTTTVVPEPATWGLMIMGFGAAGAILRRRRYAIA